MKFSTATVALLYTGACSIRSVMAEGHTGEKPWEWAGAFTLTDDSHTWLMQQVGGSYADPSMQLVVCQSTAVDAGRLLFSKKPSQRRRSEIVCEGESTNDPAGVAAIESTEVAATAAFGGDCPDVAAGSSIDLTTIVAGECMCYNLVVDETSPDSSFPLVTTGGFAEEITIFAQHVPTEFERDMHYLKDSAGTDIEPIAMEGGGHHHHHDHGDEKEGESCACVAATEGWTIDCTATAAMTDALAFLKANDCGCDCESDECLENWHIVQAHHDYCDPQGLPTAIEDDFHDFDEVCESCSIKRGFVEGAPACPAAVCTDTSGNDAYAMLLELGCLTNCASTQACIDNYFILRVVHDECDHDVLSEAAELGLHDFEEACEDVICNAPGSEEDQTTCDANTAPTEAPSSASTCSGIMAAGAATVTAASMILA